MCKYLSIIFSLLLLMSGSLLCDAQSMRKQDWDKILDQYERVCQRCVELREDALNGKRVSTRRFNSLTEELERLRSALQESGGAMTESQIKRFQQIRSLYEAESHSSVSVVEQEKEVLATEKAAPKEPAAKVLKAKIKEELSPEPEDKAQPIERLYTELPFVKIKEERLEIKDNNTEGIIAPELEHSALPQVVESRKEPQWTIMLRAAAPVFSAGASVHYHLDSSRLGLFIKIRSNFKSFKPDYLCNSDGSTVTGSIWTSGKDIKTRLCLSAGASYSINQNISAYAGCGYGEFNTAWEDNTGKWAKVQDYSASGFHADLGIMLHFNRLALSIGISSTAFRYSDLELGIGFSF